MYLEKNACKQTNQNMNWKLSSFCVFILPEHYYQFQYHSAELVWINGNISNSIRCTCSPPLTTDFTPAITNCCFAIALLPTHWCFCDKNVLNFRVTMGNLDDCSRAKIHWNKCTERSAHQHDCIATIMPLIEWYATLIGVRSLATSDMRCAQLGAVHERVKAALTVAHASIKYAEAQFLYNIYTQNIRYISIIGMPTSIYRTIKLSECLFIWYSQVHFACASETTKWMHCTEAVTGTSFNYGKKHTSTHIFWWEEEHAKHMRTTWILHFISKTTINIGNGKKRAMSASDFSTGLGYGIFFSLPCSKYYCRLPCHPIIEDDLFINIALSSSFAVSHSTEYIRYDLCLAAQRIQHIILC